MGVTAFIDLQEAGTISASLRLIVEFADAVQIVVAAPPVENQGGVGTHEGTHKLKIFFAAVKSERYSSSFLGEPIISKY